MCLLRCASCMVVFLMTLQCVHAYIVVFGCNRMRVVVSVVLMYGQVNVGDMIGMLQQLCAVLASVLYAYVVYRCDGYDMRSGVY